MNSLPPLGLYVHFPWCVKKCPYCDFNAHPLTGKLPDRIYIEILIRDLIQDLPQVWGRPVVSIFMGGGTPSLFSPRLLEDFISQLRAVLPLAPGLEITLEANPGTIERGKFSEYRSAGINRISLGVQSFAENQLKLLGRIHDRQAAMMSIEEIHAAGFSNFNVDLMHGLPEQTLEGALSDIDQAIQLGVPHISWYQLTLEPNTLFAAKPPVLPQEEVMAEIEDQGFLRLQNAGLERYEISAFAKPGHRSIHNQNYWNFGDYLGIGAGAHAKITHPSGEVVRSFKFKHPKQYLQSIENFIQKTEVISKENLPLEFMLNALRLTEGFPLIWFQERTGLDNSVIQSALDRALSKGLLELSDVWIKPTSLGSRFLNDLLLLFE